MVGYRVTRNESQAVRLGWWGGEDGSQSVTWMAVPSWTFCLIYICLLPGCLEKSGKIGRTLGESKGLTFQRWWQCVVLLKPNQPRSWTFVMANHGVFGFAFACPTYDRTTIAYHCWKVGDTVFFLGGWLCSCHSYFHYHSKGGRFSLSHPNRILSVLHYPHDQWPESLYLVWFLSSSSRTRQAYTATAIRSITSAKVPRADKGLGDTHEQNLGLDHGLDCNMGSVVDQKILQPKRKPQKLRQMKRWHLLAKNNNKKPEHLEVRDHFVKEYKNPAELVWDLSIGAVTDRGSCGLEIRAPVPRKRSGASPRRRGWNPAWREPYEVTQCYVKYVKWKRGKGKWNRILEKLAKNEPKKHFCCEYFSFQLWKRHSPIEDLIFCT